MLFNKLGRLNKLDEQSYSVVKSTLLWVLVALITTIVVFGVFVVEMTQNYAESNARRELIVRTNVAAANISPYLVKTLNGNDLDLKNHVYKTIKKQLIATKQASDDMRFVYLMKLVGNKVVFLVDAEPSESEDYSPPGQIYPNPSPALLRIFKDGESFVEGPVTDEWGVWVSGHAAIKNDDTGEIVAIIGIDINAERWNQLVSIYRWGGISITALLGALAIVYFFALWRIDRADKQRLLAADELEQAVGDLQDANKELDAFSYSVSHDLRAPLRHIAGFSQIIRDDCTSNLSEDCVEALDRMQKGVHRMDALIDGLLGLSRINRQDLSISKLDLSSMAQEVVDQLRQQKTASNSEVVVQEGMSAIGDPRLLRIVLENLLGNAWKYSRENKAPKIEFGQYQEGNKTVYYVADNGVGFDEKYSDKLFMAFQRLHHAEQFEGLGIGLSTVSRIVRRHKGRVWANGKENQGASFYFTLGL